MDRELPRAGWNLYVGLLLTTLATLAYQLLLTRIFSVTLWYHYTFVAISVTMFGLTVGAVLVYLLPRWFTPEKAARRMAAAATLFALLIVGTFLVYLRCHLTLVIDPEQPLWRMAVMNAAFLLLALPFVASGVCVTIALTRFPQETGRLYAADLVGASLGCLAVAVASRWIDGPNLVLYVAVLAALGGVFCHPGPRLRRFFGLGNLVFLSLVFLAAFLQTPTGQDRAFFRPKWIKGQIESPPIYERWNAYSRVAVRPADTKPVCWGLSPHYKPKQPIYQMWLDVDASAGTALTLFNGDLAPLDYLRYDVTNLVHYLRPNAQVLVVGSGGGRDVLSALVFRQKHVVGVEINEAILDAVNGRFGLFTGHLDQRPDVTFVNDEARSYLARSRQSFDIIQVSLVDTWAATAAGAYVLTENALYTTEAWQHMLDRLSPHGILAFNRWYTASGPFEIYRLTALAAAALTAKGVDDPRRHLIIVHRPPTRQEGSTAEVGSGMATLLTCRGPLTDADIDTIERESRRLGFEILLSPRTAVNERFADLASGRDVAALWGQCPVELTPPTDDRPFFFDMLHLRDVLTFRERKDPALEPNLGAIVTLGLLLVVVASMTVLGVVVPLALSFWRQPLRGSLAWFFYFAAIGLGFMLVEIALIERLNLFLGHPIYSMTVVLFCLLAASGAGSWLSGWLVADPVRGWRTPALLGLLIAAVLVAATSVLPGLARWDGLATPARIALAAAILLPLGVLMGMAFPLGMRAASQKSGPLTAWFFGINGATSICGSVVAVILSLCFGIALTMCVGAACYVVALVAFACGLAAR